MRTRISISRPFTGRQEPLVPRTAAVFILLRLHQIWIQQDHSSRLGTRQIKRLLDKPIDPARRPRVAHAYFRQILRPVLYLNAAEPIPRQKRAVVIGRQPDSRESRIGRIPLNSSEMLLEPRPELGVALITQVGRLVDRHCKTVTAGVLALRTNTLERFRILRSQFFSRTQFFHRRLLQNLLPRYISACAPAPVTQPGVCRKPCLPRIPSIKAP